MTKHNYILKICILLLSALLLLQPLLYPVSAAEQALPACTTETEPAAAEEISRKPLQPAIVPRAIIVRELVSMEVVKREPSRRGTIDEIPQYYQTDYPNDL